ncbi:MAG: hypothetical protein LBQ12_05925, partial [Deltaproteobacteria bacterium]|nr:hypothetical protein [Deltaproteobacteria bacterium]
PRGFHIPRGISTSWKEIINILIKFENQLFFYQVTFYLYTPPGLPEAPFLERPHRSDGILQGISLPRRGLSGTSRQGSTQALPQERSPLWLEQILIKYFCICNLKRF